MTRAAPSTLPPAGYGTIRRTDRAGHCWASAGVFNNAANSADAATPAIAKNFIAFSRKAAYRRYLLFCARPVPPAACASIVRAAMLRAALPLSTKLWCLCPRCGHRTVRMTNGRLKARGPAPRQGGQAIRRALGVLRTLAVGGEKGVPLAEVVQATSLARPTVHRIVHVLIEEGIVERSERTGNYVVGRQVPELALARPSRSPLMVAAEPHLAEASAQLGDTLFLTVRTGFDTLCVARRIGGYPIQVLSIEVGVRRPLGVSSAGVAILAAMPAAEAPKIVLANETRFGAYRTDTAAVLGQIQLARRRGYTLREVGLVQGTKSLSAWIRTPDGQPAAAITLSAMRNRLGPRRAIEVADVLVATARAIEAATPRGLP